MPSPLHVVHCDFGRTWRGGQQQLLLLALELRRLDWQQTVIAPAPAIARRFADEGFPTATVDLAGGVRARRANILHVHDGRALGWGLFWRALTPPAALVFSRRVAFPLHSRVTLWKYRHAGRIIAVSDYIRDQLLAAGLPTTQVTVVRDGVDQELLQPAANPSARNVTRRNWQVPDAAVCLVSLSALSEEKGVPDLVEALALLPDSVHLLLAGEGALRSLIEQRSRKLGLQNRMHWSNGAVTPTALVQAGDIFVLPSHQEGLGSSVLLAHALRRPVIATRVGGVPELVSDEVTGLLVAPGQPPALAAAVQRLMRDPALGARLVNRAWDQVQSEFSSARMAALTDQVYRRQLAR
ncbi:MAG: glycosyltransferase family 4 protein [Terriglobales bacterium]